MVPTENGSTANAKPLLVAKGVTVQFGGLRALDNVSLSVNQGEIVSIIGPNGAGKTTLFQVLSGFVRPTQGSVQFRGERIDGKSPVEICKRGLTRTFQIVEVFPTLSVYETLVAAALVRAPMAEARRIALETAELIGLADKRHALCRQLTLPDQKALEVGKAVATRPTMILLDEVMAGLRPTEAQYMVDLIRSLRTRGITFVLVEHIMEIIMRISDRVVVIGAGANVCEGSPEKVAHDPRVIEIYLGGEIPHA